MAEDRLMRTRLLLGDANVLKLQNATVVVVGCGAVGSYAVEALARAGIGHLRLVDLRCNQRWGKRKCWLRKSVWQISAPISRLKYAILFWMKAMHTRLFKTPILLWMRLTLAILRLRFTKRAKVRV